MTYDLAKAFGTKKPSTIDLLAVLAGQKLNCQVTIVREQAFVPHLQYNVVKGYQISFGRDNQVIQTTRVTSVHHGKKILALLIDLKNKGLIRSTCDETGAPEVPNQQAGDIKCQEQSES